MHAQNTLWGTTINGGQFGFGYIYRTDSIGNNLIIVHSFDNIHDGRAPGPVMQASNGKIYGMTISGGPGVITVSVTPSFTYNTAGGTLFEYDPVIDSFKTLIAFNSTDPQYPPQFYNPSSLKLLEASPGILWAVLTEQINNVGALNRYIMAYNISSNTISLAVTVPSWNTTATTDVQYTGLSGELYKDANGYVYGTTSGYSACAANVSFQVGSIIRMDPSTNAFSYIYPFDCGFINDGYIPQGNMEDEGNGKLYSYTQMGGNSVYYPNMGYGVIYEYDPTTNTFTKKYDFTGGVLGASPMGYILKAPNGKLYGTAYGGTNSSGILYEYDPASNTYTKKQDFIDLHTPATLGPYGILWLVSSANGKIYGTTQYGMFEYNTTTNQTRLAARFIEPTYNTSANAIIEVCRKPAYKFNTVTNYTICAGSFFSYDLHCTNAQTFVWKHNGVADASQVTSILNFNHIAITDAGNWVCEMTNECGTTTSSTITIVVNAAGTGVITSTLTPAGTTSICPTNSITLSGNNSGTWNTGATTSSIITSNPGTYQVINSNACGNTYSNIITIDTIPSPLPQLISFPMGPYSTGPELSAYMCPGDSLLLSGNTNGVWNTGETSYSIYVNDLLPHYVITSNACKTVTSATAQAAYSPVGLPPTITPTGFVQICTGDSLLLQAVGASGDGTPLVYNWYNNGSFVAYTNNFYVKQSGVYYAMTTSICGSITSQTLTLTADSVALDTAIITTSGSTTFCQGSSIVLQSNYNSCVWSTGATTPSITVTQPGTYQVTNSNGCSSVTSASVTTTVIPAPTVSYVELHDSVCLTTVPYSLGTGSPSGGYYTGHAVSSNMFNPSVAGSGIDTVTYNYQDMSTGCVGKATQELYVDYDPAISVAGSATICAGNTTVLYQTLLPLGTWSTGQSDVAISVSQSGIYYVTKTNICGNAVNSNSIQVTVNPLPAIPLITQSGNSLQSTVAASYQWYLNGAIVSGAISQIYTPTQSGNYTVIISDNNGCSSTSNIFTYSITGINTIDKENNAISIYPNPSSCYFTVEFLPTTNQVLILNAVGQIVQKKEVDKQTSLQFSLMENGIYFIQFHSGKQTITRKIIISQ